MSTCRHHPDRPSQLLEDVRYIHVVSGRRARRLVFSASPTPWVGSSCSTAAPAGNVSLFIASGAVAVG